MTNDDDTTRTTNHAAEPSWLGQSASLWAAGMATLPGTLRRRLLIGAGALAGVWGLLSLVVNRSPLTALMAVAMVVFAAAAGSVVLAFWRVRRGHADPTPEVEPDYEAEEDWFETASKASLKEHEAVPLLGALGDLPKDVDLRDALLSNGAQMPEGMTAHVDVWWLPDPNYRSRQVRWLGQMRGAGSVLKRPGWLTYIGWAVVISLFPVFLAGLPFVAWRSRGKGVAAYWARWNALMGLLAGKRSAEQAAAAQEAAQANLTEQDERQIAMVEAQTAVSGSKARAADGWTVALYLHLRCKQEDAPIAIRERQHMEHALTAMFDGPGEQALIFEECPPYLAAAGYMDSRAEVDGQNSEMAMDSDALAALTRALDGDAKPAGVTIERSGFKTITPSKYQSVESHQDFASMRQEHEDPRRRGLIAMGILDPGTTLARNLVVEQLVLDTHMLTEGGSGSGKSVFCISDLLHCINDPQPNAQVLFDPKGPLAPEALHAIATYMPQHLERVIYLDLTDENTVYAYNPFDARGGEKALDGMLKEVQMFSGSLLGLDENATRALPYMEAVARAFGEVNQLLDEPYKLTMQQISRFLAPDTVEGPNQFRQEIMSLVQSEEVHNYFGEHGEYTLLGPKGQPAVSGIITRKLGRRFMTTDFRAGVGSPVDRFDIERWINERKIILINTGAGEENGLVGKMLTQSLISKIYRVGKAAKGVRVTIFCDEAETLLEGVPIEPLKHILSKGRSSQVRLFLYCQYLGQLPTKLAEAVIKNCGTLRQLKEGGSSNLSPYIDPQLDPTAVQHFPKYHVLGKSEDENQHVMVWAGKNPEEFRFPDAPNDEKEAEWLPEAVEVLARSKEAYGLDAHEVLELTRDHTERTMHAVANLVALPTGQGHDALAGLMPASHSQEAAASGVSTLEVEAPDADQTEAGEEEEVLYSDEELFKRAPWLAAVVAASAPKPETADSYYDLDD